MMDAEGLRRMGRENPVSEFTPEIVDGKKERQEIEYDMIQEMKERVQKSDRNESTDLSDYIK